MCFKFSEYVVYITSKNTTIYTHVIFTFIHHITLIHIKMMRFWNACLTIEPSLRFCTFELFISHYIVIQTTQTGLSSQFIYDAKWSFRKRTDARNLDWNTYTWNTEAGLEHLHLEHLNNFREPTRLTPDV